MSAMSVVREAFGGFRKAKLAAFGSVLTIALSLLLLGLFTVISANTSRVLDALREKVEMEAFLDEPAAPQRIEEIRKAILAVPGVDSVRFVSKEEAARVFKEEFGEDIKSVLDFNPLPPSFKITLAAPSRTSAAAAAIQKGVGAVKGVADVVYRKEILEFLERQAQTLYNVGLGLGILIGFTAIFLVFNTIRLSIYASRLARAGAAPIPAAEATWWSVRGPFILEGIIQGVLGGGIAALVLYYLATAGMGMFSAELAGFFRVDAQYYWGVAGAGFVLGLMGSAISVRRFLKAG